LPIYAAQKRDQIADGDEDSSGFYHLGPLWRENADHVANDVDENRSQAEAVAA
jgi:hypothetical protein